MLFKEALDALQAGDAMRRTDWPIAEGYLKILPGMKHIWKIVLQPNPNAGNFIFSMDDFLGDDWVKLDPANPFPEPVVVEQEIAA